MVEKKYNYLLRTTCSLIMVIVLVLYGRFMGFIYNSETAHTLLTAFFIALSVGSFYNYMRKYYVKNKHDASVSGEEQ